VVPIAVKISRAMDVFMENASEKISILVLPPVKMKKSEHSAIRNRAQSSDLFIKNLQRITCGEGTTIKNSGQPFSRFAVC
jgi:hypothetical protein